MPRRKEIKGIAHGFISHFISRNNDVSGYWAMGVLYKHAVVNRSFEIQIDLLSQTITPSSQAFDDMLMHWKNG